MTDQDLELNSEQQVARDAVRGLEEVSADPAFRSRLAREFASGLFSPHRGPEPVAQSSSFGAFLRWMYVPVAAALLVFVAIYGNRGPDWEVVGTSPEGTLTVDGEAFSVTDRSLDRLLSPGASVALSPKTELTLKVGDVLTLQLAPGTQMTLPSRPNRWFGRGMSTSLESGEARFLTGPDFSGRALVMTTSEGRAEIVGTVVSLLRDIAMGATCVCVMEGEARIGMNDEDMQPIQQGRRKVMFADGREPMVVAILPEHHAGLIRFVEQYGDKDSD